MRMAFKWVAGVCFSGVRVRVFSQESYENWRKVDFGLAHESTLRLHNDAVLSLEDFSIPSNECGDPFLEDDIVVLNGSKEEQEKLQKAMEERRAKAKTAKKSKKNKALETIFKSPESKVFESKSASANGESSSISTDSAPGPSGASKPVKPTAAAGSKRSIQDMEEKSEAYKSIFTSHSSAKRTKDQMSNWVTHTPYHF